MANLNAGFSLIELCNEICLVNGASQIDALEARSALLLGLLTIICQDTQVSNRIL